MKSVLFSLLATMIALALVSGTEAADKEKKKKKEAVPTGTVVGTIKSVSADEKMLTIATPPADKKSIETTTDVKISAKTKVEYEGIDPIDQKLKAGYAVTVKMDDTDKGTAATIMVKKATMTKKKKDK